MEPYRSEFGDELIRLSLEGHKKRKRTEDAEEKELPVRLGAEWLKNRAEFKRRATNNGEEHFSFVFSCEDNSQYWPETEDVRENLPEELKDLARDDRYGLTVEEVPYKSYQWKISFCIEGEMEKIINERDQAGFDWLKD